MVESVTITDNRNGQSIEIPIVDGGVAADQWSKLLPGVWFYDPAFMTTAAAESAITFVDGEKGILEYRGYPIEQLTKQSTYLEVAYLLLNGELPTAAEADKWVQEITYHTFIHESMRKRFLEGFHYDAHPMGILVSAIVALSTYYPDAKNIFDPVVRHKQIIRLIAKMPTLAAAAHRYSVGMPFVYPDNSPRLPVQFPVDGAQDSGVPLRREPRPRAGDGRFVHLARRPRAELLHGGAARGRLVPGRPILRVRSSLRRPLRAPARGCERGRHPDAHRYRRPRERP